MATTTKEVRQYLVDYFTELAQFRRQKAEESAERRPWDAPKNEAYALSLERMVSYVARLPEDDPTLIALRDCKPLYDDCSEMWCIPSHPDSCAGYQPEINQRAVHCGPRGNAMDQNECGDWFAGWASSLIEGAPAMRSESDRAWRLLGGGIDEEEDGEGDSP